MALFKIITFGKNFSIKSGSIWFFIVSLAISIYVGLYIPPTWTVESISLDIQKDNSGKIFYQYKGKPKYIPKAISYKDALLNREQIRHLNKIKKSPAITEEYVYQIVKIKNKSQIIYNKLEAKRHWGLWSLLPAIVAVFLAWLSKEPVTALFGGIVVGALILGQYDITKEVLIPSLASKGAASVLILYLWFLGGLMGIWSKTGAAQAFADYMTEKVVRGPKTAKLVAWFLGVIFFQGGTISTVLVGTTVKPLADKEKISHEELAYIVDSTASPIASQLAFNAWPGYIQAFIYVAGVSFLATEADRIIFFFKSVPFCFYAIFAVTFTFLLSLDKAPFLGKGMKDAIVRARTTGKLDADDAKPLSAKELQTTNIPVGYTPHIIEFFLPLMVLIGTAIGTFIYKGTPEVLWAFGLALFVAISLALLRGMGLMDLIDGFQDGLKGVVMGSVILLLAMTIGGISKATGGGIFLVELIGQHLPYWTLPVILQVLTMTIAFSTGTSWGTYAVAFPLAMPLAWGVATSAGLAHPELFMTICFAAVMDGSVYGDQCSPISDTTVLSAMCTGCDLMAHVKTQIPQASIAAALAACCWTLVTLIFV